MRIFTTTLIVASIAACGATAMAQGANPSADQIIKSLTPTGDVSKVTTRGIRKVAQPDDTAPSAQAAPEPVGMQVRTTMVAAKPVMAHQAALPSVNLTVNFETGSAELTPAAMQTLDALGTALSSDALSHYRFRVEGHTDTVGTPDANRSLSERRAEAVVRYIASKYAVSADKMQPVGMGSDRPLIVTASQVAEPRNRRVQIVNLGG